MKARGAGSIKVRSKLKVRGTGSAGALMRHQRTLDPKKAGGGLFGSQAEHVRIQHWRQHRPDRTKKVRRIGDSGLVRVFSLFSFVSRLGSGGVWSSSFWVVLFFFVLSSSGRLLRSAAHRSERHSPFAHVRSWLRSFVVLCCLALFSFAYLAQCSLLRITWATDFQSHNH